MTKLYFIWALCKPDPVQFKPNSPELIPENIVVCVNVDDKYILEKTDDRVVITPAGMADALGKLRNALVNSYTD